MTFTTAAFGRSSSWWFGASSYKAAPKGPPPSLVQHDASHRRIHDTMLKSANGSAPRGRETPVEEGSTRIVVDWSGSWRAAWSGNRPGRSLATKVALGG